MAIEMKAGNAQKGSKTARATAKKSPTAKITKAELKAKLRDIDIPDEELAKYFVVDQESSSGFSPQVVINDTLIEDDGLEGVGLLNIANSVARWRRNRTYKRRIKNWTGIKIVAEGDSWYQYPLLLKDLSLIHI